MKWMRGPYQVSDDRVDVDIDLVAAFLATEAYWSPGIPVERVRTAIDNSLCLSAFHAEEQVGFARVVTDRATFAYLCDVFVVQDHRGKGLGHWLAELAVNHPAVEGVRSYLLGTKDAHAIYRNVGFSALSNPDVLMEIRRDPLEIYGTTGDQRPHEPERSIE